MSCTLEFEPTPLSDWMAQLIDYAPADPTVMGSDPF